MCSAGAVVRVVEVVADLEAILQNRLVLVRPEIRQCNKRKRTSKIQDIFECNYLMFSSKNVHFLDVTIEYDPRKTFILRRSEQIHPRTFRI